MTFSSLGMKRGPAEIWWENGRLHGGPIRKKARRTVHAMLCDRNREDLRKWLNITKTTPAAGFTFEELDDIKRDLTGIVEHVDSYDLLEGARNELLHVNDILPLWIIAKRAKNKSAMPKDNKSGNLVKGEDQDAELSFMKTEYQQTICHLLL